MHFFITDEQLAGWHERESVCEREKERERENERERERDEYSMTDEKQENTSYSNLKKIAYRL